MARDWMIWLRQAQGMSQRAMAKKCECGILLLIKIEEFDWVTHPHIASRIAHAYGMTVEEYDQIVPEKHKTKKLPKPVPPPKDIELSKIYLMDK